MFTLGLPIVSLALAALTAAAPHERRAGPPAGFTRRGAVAGGSVLDLQLALPLHDFTGLQRELDEISTPDAPRYGEVLSKEQVQGYMRPKDESAKAVKDWLSSNHIQISSESTYGDILKISLNASKANALFQTDFAEYEHGDSGRVFARAMQYSLPAEIKAHVLFIDSAISFPLLPRRRAKRTLVDRTTERRAIHVGRALPTSCPDDHARPKCVQDMYGLPTAPVRQTSNFIGVAGFGDQNALISDLSLFLATYRPDIPSDTFFAIDPVGDGTNSQSIPGTTEASLDLQWTIGLATGVPVTYYPVGSGSMLDLLNHIFGLDQPPKFLSVSYTSGADITSSAAQAQRICQAAAAVTARGTIPFFSGGDHGVARDAGCPQFELSIPASCPFIVSVGWTQVTSPEIVSPDSTGGFSNIFGRENWQDPVASRYIAALGTAFAGLYNTTGRGVPDVSAVGYVREVVNGNFFLVQGSSASTPITTAIFALLNDELVSAGKAALPGNLNPTIYLTRIRPGFNDVTSGNNHGANCAQGFNATAGWDPASGIGTPNFAQLRQVFGLI